MRYFIIIDSLRNILYLHSGNNFETILENYVEVSEEDYKILETLFIRYKFMYQDGKIVNLGEREVEVNLTVEEQKLIEIAENISLLIELQADIIGGVI